MMEVRYLKESDYDDILVGWWSQWRWSAPAKDMLPQNGAGGIMVSKDGEDICAGFVYFTNSKTAWIEYIISNPNYKNREDRKNALNMLINVLSIYVEQEGYKYIYTSLKNKHLIDRYEDCGFLSGDKNCQEMIKILQ
jgi:hypothetical protein